MERYQLLVEDDNDLTWDRNGILMDDDGINYSNMISYSRGTARWTSMVSCGFSLKAANPLSQSNSREKMDSSLNEQQQAQYFENNPLERLKHI